MFNRPCEGTNMRNLSRKSAGLLAIACLCFIGAAVAAIPLEASDTDRPKVRPAVHHVAPTDQQRDLDALKAEVQRLRAEVERCSLARK